MPTSYRVSGHESFPCRYSWLPKAVRGLRKNPRLFAADAEDDAMVDLGRGKNMVRSLRFWAQAAGVAKASDKSGSYEPTEFGDVVLGHEGFDEFLEDTSTLWLLHWNLSTNIESPLLAWDFLLSRWQEPDFTAAKAVEALDRELKANEADLSKSTIEQHLEAFLHTYVPTRSRKGLVQEDNLDCPLVELELIVRVGSVEAERKPGTREPIYAFRREEKPEISSDLFVYCLNDFWTKRFPKEKTLPLKEIAHGHGSPGQIFKLPEDDIRARIEDLGRQTDGYLRYVDSATQQQIHRQGERDNDEFLVRIYSTDEVPA